MESRNNKKCVICHKRRNRGSNIFLSQFPIDSECCQVWVKNAGIEDLAYLPIEKLHQLKYICGSHFSQDSFNAKGTRLKKTAIPTLELLNPILPDEILTEFPLHIKDSNKENLESVHMDHSYCIEKKSKPAQRGALTCYNVVQPQTTQLEAIETAAVDTRTHTLFPKFIPLPSTSKAPDNVTYDTVIVDMVHSETEIKSYTRSKKSTNAKEVKQIMTIREKRLLRQLNNAKKTIRTLARSRVNLDKLDSEMLSSLVKDVCNNAKKKPQGKRWTLENKIYALAIFKRSPKAYRYMQKLVTLPSVKTLQRILKEIPMGPGINENIINILESKAESLANENKYCALLFDEMCLKKRLIYNEVSDQIEGYVDFGHGEDMGREKNIADHVMVFMMQGLKYKFKQYIAHYFVEGTISTQKLTKIITNIIKKLKEIGFTVLTTICDQGSTNIGALNMLKKNTGGVIEDHFFHINNEKIYTIYDIPHLFKSLRNGAMETPYCCGGKESRIFELY